MARAKHRKVQTCSLCEKTGHNKRRCSLRIAAPSRYVETKNSTHKEIFVPRTKSTVRTKKVVPGIRVYTHKKSSLSDHVINLKQEEADTDTFWKKVQSFQEHTWKPRERTTVDFAAMVRSSRDSQKKHHARVVRPFGFVGRIKKYMHTLGFALREVCVNFVHRIKRSIPTVRILPTVKFPKFSLHRFATLALVLSIIVSIPFPVSAYYQRLRAQTDKIVTASTHGFSSLQASTFAVLNADVDGAGYALQDALQAFSEVERVLEKDEKRLLQIVRAIPFFGEEVKSREALVRAGQHVALGNTYLVKGVEDISKDDDRAMTDRLQLLQSHMNAALPQYERALDELMHVKPEHLPKQYASTFEEARVLFAAFINDMHDLSDLSDVLYDMFGGDSVRRYLVLFQNHHELRPTGGFIGSFALLDTQKGRIETIDIPAGGSYDLQGQLTKYVEPPLPLQLVNGRWEFQDSNWFFDFGASAEKAEWFLEHSRGITVDGTIAVNASVIERLLSVVGPIVELERDLVLESDSALQILQQEVEFGDEKKQGKPKAVLSDVADQLFAVLKESDKGKLLLLLGELHDALEEKEIQVAVHENALDATFDRFGWTGSLTEIKEGQDYMAVVAANLRGQKSDARIEQKIFHTAEIGNNGSVINTVRINRTHTAYPGEQFHGAPNTSFIRLYVPEGAVLLSAGGFRYPPEHAFHVPESWYEDDVHLAAYETEEGIHLQTGTRVSEEFGKTVFGNWMIVEPGETEEIWFQYELPFSVVSRKQESQGRLASLRDTFFGAPDRIARYQLVADKQSGTASTFVSEVVYDSSWTPSWMSDSDIQIFEDRVQYSDVLDTNTTYGFVLSQE